MKDLETTATIEKQQRLRLDKPVPATSSERVRVIIFFSEEDEINENEWFKAASKNPTFDFLKDPEEGIYRSTDGKPFHD